MRAGGGQHRRPDPRTRVPNEMSAAPRARALSRNVIIAAAVAAVGLLATVSLVTRGQADPDDGAAARARAKGCRAFPDAPAALASAPADARIGYDMRLMRTPSPVRS